VRPTMWMLLLAAGPVTAAADPAPAPPLACPQCGHWELDGASRGMTGEWLSIQPDRVDFPALGRYCARTIEHSSEADGNGRQRHRVLLALTPRVDDCSTSAGQDLRMQIDVDAGAVEGSHASMIIQDGSKTVLESGAWNVDREDPCDAGRNAPFIACYSMDHARLYKQLGYASYAIGRSLPKPQATVFARRFSPERFAGEVERFCDRQGTLNGAGSGATLVSKRCQVERLGAKLHELEAWQVCLRTKERACKTPGQDFDKAAAE
jgi:hypothetical protein